MGGFVRLSILVLSLFLVLAGELYAQESLTPTGITIAVSGEDQHPKLLVVFEEESSGAQSLFSARSYRLLSADTVSACYATENNFFYAQGNSVHKIEINPLDYSIASDSSVLTTPSPVINLVAGQGCLVVATREALLVSTMQSEGLSRRSITGTPLNLIIDNSGGRVALLTETPTQQREVSTFQLTRNAGGTCQLSAPSRGTVNTNAIGYLPNGNLVGATGNESFIFSIGEGGEVNRLYTMQVGGSHIRVGTSQGTTIIYIQNNRDLSILSSTDNRIFSLVTTLRNLIDHLSTVGSNLSLIGISMADLRAFSREGTMIGEVSVGNTGVCLSGWSL